MEKDNFIVKIFAALMIGLMLLLGVGIDIAWHTKILHQPAKCAFTKCVVILK